MARRTRITNSQKSARRRNIKIARLSKSKSGASSKKQVKDAMNRLFPSGVKLSTKKPKFNNANIRRSTKR